MVKELFRAVARPTAIRLAAISMLAAGLSHAAVIGDPVGLDINGVSAGSRTENALQLITGGNYATDGQNFTVAWNIVLNGSTYTYQYVFSNYGSPAMSHITYDTTDNCLQSVNQAACISNIVSTASIGQTEWGTFGPGPSNPGFPVGQSITGIKFDSLGENSGFTLTFDSLRAPMWGNIYVKGGNDSFMYTAGLADPTATENFLIPVVDTVGAPDVAIPEPGTWVLMVSGIGLLAAGRRFRARQNVG